MDSKGAIVEQIVGNVFIVSHDDEGETISLTDEQIKAVLSTVQTGFIQRGLSFRMVAPCIAKI